MKGFSIAILFILLLTACAKEEASPTPLPKEEYGFNATIGGKQVDLRYSSEEKLVNGQYGRLGGVETYRVVVDLGNENINYLGKTELVFELYDLQEKLFKINSQDLYPSLGENRITLYQRFPNFGEERVVYAPSSTKKAFEIRVTNIKYHDYSMIPTVSGSLQGILYNVMNYQDSIIIKNGNFKSRF